MCVTRFRFHVRDPKPKNKRCALLMTQGEKVDDFSNDNFNKQVLSGKHGQAAIGAFSGNRQNIREIL